MNRILKSQAIEIIKEKFKDGTVHEFVDNWRWIFSYSKKYKKQIIFYTFLGVISTTLSLGASVVSKYLIDIVTGYKMNQLWLLVAVMLLSTLFSVIFSSLVSRYAMKLNIYVNNDIQAEIFDKIMDADWMEMSRYSSGDLLNRFNNDVNTVAANAVTWIPDVVIGIYTFVSTLAVILYYDAMMAVIALISAPVLLFFGRYLMRKNNEYRKKVLEADSDIMSFETETFYNFDTIKSFGITKRYGREMRRWQEIYKDVNLEFNWFGIKTNAWMSLLGSFVGFVAFAYCLFRLWTHSITYGTMTLFLSQSSSLSDSFQSLVKILPGMLNSAVSAGRIRELVDLPKEIHDEEAAHGLHGIADDGFSICMKEVAFSYAEGQPVLTKSNFIARPNEIVALVGPSGEGKTTMLRMILALIYPDKGTVVMEGSDGRAIPMNADLRSFFSYVPQGNTIFAGTIADNLRMVKEDAADEELVEALKIACAWDFVKKMELGIYSPVGEGGQGLSEGQAQRVAIARAVLRNCPILMLDEATSALDVKTERQVLKNIIRQRPNKTCIVTTHRPSVLNMCQRVYRVMGTRVTELSEEESSRMVQDF